MLVQNYIVNLDLYVHCEPINDFTLCPCLCAPPEYVRCGLIWKIAVMLGVTPTCTSTLYMEKGLKDHQMQGNTGRKEDFVGTREDC